MTARARYTVPFSYPNAVDIRNYGGTNLLVPARTIRVERDLLLPERLVGKRLWIRVVVEERP